MLQSYIGKYDAGGLCSLRSEGESETVVVSSENGEAHFWAVLDSSELASIEHALIIAGRGAALKVICERAKTLGSLTN